MVDSAEDQLFARPGDVLTVPEEGRTLTIVVQTPAVVTEEDEIDLVDYLRVVRKRWLWLLVAVLLPTGWVGAGWLAADPQFTATVAFTTPQGTGLWEDRIISIEVVRKLVDRVYPIYDSLHGHTQISLADYFQTRNADQIWERIAAMAHVEKAGARLGSRLGILAVTASDSVFASAVANDWIREVRASSGLLRERDLKLHEALVSDLREEMLHAIQDSLHIADKLARLASGDGTSVTLNQQMLEARLRCELTAQQLSSTQLKLTALRTEMMSAAMLPLQVVRLSSSNTCSETRGNLRRKLALSGAVGLVLGIFGVFAHEYVQKVRDRW